MGAERLDVGVGLQLRGVATDGRNQMQAIAWMTSEDVQGLLEQISMTLLTHSLAVEREAAHVKRWESSKVTHVATASLNNICVQFSRERDGKARAIDAAMDNMKKIRKRRNTCFKMNDESRPLGVLWHHDSAKTQTHSNPSGPGHDSQTAQTYPSGSGQVKRKMTTNDERNDFKDQNEASLQTAHEEVQSLLRSCYVPMTRYQWEAWLEHNIAEFRQRMKTDYVERRKRSTRIRARPDLPKSASRIHPKPLAHAELESEWAMNLARRTGWYGLQTGKEKMMFVLACHAGETFYIDLEPNRVGEVEELAYAFNEEFYLTTQLHPLFELEAELSDVCGAFQFTVKSEPRTGTGGGYIIRPVSGKRITEPLPRPKQQKGEAEDAGDEGCCGDEETEGEEEVVDTDVETDIEGSSSESECSGSDDDTVGKPHMDPKEPITPITAKPKAGHGLTRLPKATLWDNGYFYVPEVDTSKGSTEQHGLRIWLRGSAADGLASDKKGITTFLTPKHYGETMADPTVTILLLRAWMLWRVGDDGWVKEKTCRSRQFEEEAISLKRDIMAMQLNKTGGGLLGNNRANAMLQNWVPTVVA